MAHSMSPEELQELGRGYYKLKQYDKAVEAFAQAIDIAPTLSLFDHRAAAYDRLEKYDAAIRDGRSMIKADKQDVRGYLRTASVLEKMQKHDTALGIYKYGMKNVPVGDKNFKLLQQLHDKITRKLSPAKSVDPLTVLPVELAEMILEYLAFRNLVNCMRVSRGWRDYIAKLSRLWMHLDLSGARRPVPRSFINKAVRRSENRLTKATIHRFEHVDVLKNVAKACNGLRELEFITLPHTMSSTLIEIVQCAPSLKRFIVHPEITQDAATQLLQNRPDLEHVGFSSVKRLRTDADWRGPFPFLTSFSLTLVDTWSSRSLQIPALLGQAVNLQSLMLGNVFFGANDCSSVPLTTLVLRRVTFTNDTVPILPATLQKLGIEYAGSMELRGNEHTLLQSRLPVLTHLGLADINMLSADRFEQLLDTYIDAEDPGQIKTLENATPLQSISIRGILKERTDGLFKFAIGLFARSPRILTPSLQSLDIATMPCDDDEIEQLLNYKTGLINIDLSSTRITGASIKMLADHLPNLRTIKADNCPRISGRDAIDYARMKGISVSCSMDEGKGSRKIRYG
ncbi:hypothetical protein CC86DRAFT_374372 [Ophiobolus disseminans]|uniref:F-box domain-containing protein n=1 Tax=Ophiobolus disseminans TaxID=1469910 RepID=A0A6A6ZIL2_9PLEO|nr:hypothetical protein CC86DRAFT_374372 [Ophiobolus disseminans]